MQMTGPEAGLKFSQTGVITALISAKCTHGFPRRHAASMSVMLLKIKIDFLKVLNSRMSGELHAKWRHRKTKAWTLLKKRWLQAITRCIWREQSEDSHSDFFTGNKAVDWLENYKSDQPFFLEIGFPGPHPPYDPVPSFLKLYDEVHIPIAEVLESDLDGQPRALKALRQHNADIDHDSIVHQLDPSDEARLRQRKHYSPM